MKGKKPLNAPYTPSDFGTSERIQHTSGVRYERTSKKLGSEKRLRITNQTPLDRMLQRDHITQRQFDAGQKLYALHRKAGQSQRLTSNYSANIVDGGSGGNGDNAGEAFSEYLAALRSVGRDLASVLQWVVVQGSAPNEWAKNNGHSPKGGIVAVRLALDAVGDYFRIAR